MPVGNQGTTSSTAIRQVTYGASKRDCTYTADVDHTADLEYEVSNVSDNIVATDQETFSYVRVFYSVWNVATYIVYEWMIIRMKTADSLPDMTSSTAIEDLQDEKRIIRRGIIIGSPYESPKAINATIYNLVLPAGEELRLVIRPITTVADNTSYQQVEWRQVGV